MKGDLTTLDAVSGWLSPDTGTLTLGPAQTTLLSRLITAASAFVLNYINRSTLAQASYDEWYDGGGNPWMLVRQWPVTALASIQFCGIEITQQATGNPPANGYILEPPPQGGGQQRLMLYGWRFPRGRGTIRLQYTAGYFIVGEPHTIPATPGTDGKYTVDTDFAWLEDGGVKYASSGIALTYVATGTPTVGQYTIDVNGDYLFAAADADVGVLISYSYAPADIEQAVIELVGERYKVRDRIGLRSKNLPNGETVVFDIKDMSDHVKSILQPYRRVTPT